MAFVTCVHKHGGGGGGADLAFRRKCVFCNMLA